MTSGAKAKISQMSVAEYTEYFEQFFKERKDVLHVKFSSGLSGSLNFARLSAEELREKYPDRRLYLTDSLVDYSGYGLITETLANQRGAGMSLEELYRWIKENRLRMHHWFFSTDLSFYIKGGRISKTAGIIGCLSTAELNMDNQGKLQPRENIRTKKKVIRRIVEMMELHVRDGLDYSGKCYICHSAWRTPGRLQTL